MQRNSLESCPCLMAANGGWWEIDIRLLSEHFLGFCPVQAQDEMVWPTALSRGGVLLGSARAPIPCPYGPETSETAAPGCRPVFALGNPGSGPPRPGWALEWCGALALGRSVASCHPGLWKIRPLQDRWPRTPHSHRPNPLPIGPGSTAWAGSGSLQRPSGTPSSPCSCGVMVAALA